MRVISARCREYSIMDYRSIVSNIYELHDPSKLSQLDIILRTFQGREEALIRELRRKFNISDEEYQHIHRGGAHAATPPPPSYQESTVDAPMLPGGAGGVIPVQAQAVSFNSGEYITAQDVKIHEDHIPMTTGGLGQPIGNRGVYQITNPDGTVSYAVAQPGGPGAGGSMPRSSNGHALSMRGFQDQHGRAVVMVEEDRRGRAFGYNCGRACFTIYVVFVSFIIISSVISAMLSRPSNDDDEKNKKQDDDANLDDDINSRRSMRGLRGASSFIVEEGANLVLDKVSDLLVKMKL